MTYARVTPICPSPLHLQAQPSVTTHIGSSPVISPPVTAAVKTDAYEVGQRKSDEKQLNVFAQVRSPLRGTLGHQPRLQPQSSSWAVPSFSEIPSV